MSIFKKIFGGEKDKNKDNIDNSRFSSLKKDDFVNLKDLIEQNAGLSFEKQSIFADVVGQNGWQLDMDKGTISFGNLDFPIQIIGSLAFNNNSWMWGWANTQSNIPENLLIQSNELKKIGIEKNITELQQEKFNVVQGFEHKLGMMACGLFNAKSYYCANYGQGTLVVTITDEKIPNIDKNRLEKVLTTFPQLISAVSLDHKNTLKSYLIDRDFKLNISKGKIEGLKNDKIITAEFDELNRLKSLNGKI